MKRILVLTAITVFAFQLKAQDESYAKDWNKPYSPEWEELKAKEIPEWMLDAKFGIYTHWGIYSVPAHGGPDYIKELYNQNEDRKGVQAYHKEKYGPLEEFGYMDFVPMFKAEKFDAKEWADIMKDGGVKFAGICLAHHDGFALWDSKHTKWDAMDMGPKKNIYGELAKEIRNNDLKLAATFHMARTYGYPYTGKYTDEQKANYDIFNPEYAFAFRNPDKLSKEDFSREWAAKVREVIDDYNPDVIWFDGLKGSIKNDEIPEDTIVNILKYYHETGEKAGQEVVVCNKLPGGKVWNFPAGYGLRCYENCRDMETNPQGYWLADRAIAYPWSWVNNKKYKDSYDYHIKSLVDMVSRGGIFFLSLTPKGDGSIPDEEKEIMAGMGRWLRINGEAIYETRRWKTPGEGETNMLVWRKGKNAYRWDFRGLNASDVRFTRNKENTVLYATVLGWPESGEYTIKALSSNEKIADKGIDSIEMIGSKEKIKWERTEEGLKLYFPKEKPCEVAYAFKIKVKGKLVY